ncbi:unnamed protein product [Strongylus vulgaris]|uniref:Uncharacterized protein n=1 Tax=Strongylus vulgaris TaxID=40348 RepID=A0A3P7KP52_STRVU|nr:unnamed protein product [Strongylus vulgaris]
MQLATSSRKEQQEKEAMHKVRMNGFAEHSTAKVPETAGKAAEPKKEYNWRAKRPIVVKRRVSPQESSTSESRRSSNQSNRSPPRNDSLCDRRVLVRRGSGSAVVRRSITQQLSPSTVPTTTLRPFAQGVHFGTKQSCTFNGPFWLQLDG